MKFAFLLDPFRLRQQFSSEFSTA